MPYIKGALVEYGSDFMGPIPNVVFFQFNPTSLTRSIEIPPRGSDEESDQAGTPPKESISFTAEFNASEQIGRGDIDAKIFGVGPSLAALEKMVYPEGRISEIVSAIFESLDNLGDMISSYFGGAKDEYVPIPRQKYPRILFVWGAKRLLPVIIQSMKIVEERYDTSLNPISAKVDLTLITKSGREVLFDPVAQGALEYTGLIKESQAATNLVTALSRLPKKFAAELETIIPF